MEAKKVHHSLKHFRENTDDYLTYPASMIDRFVETHRVDVPGRPSRPVGYSQWAVGDRASIHLATNPNQNWTLIEVRIVEVLGKQNYRVMVEKFDGKQESMTGVSIGDLIDLPGSYFYAVWANHETRDDGEGPQKIHVDGTLNRRYKKEFVEAVLGKKSE